MLVTLLSARMQQTSQKGWWKAKLQLTAWDNRPK